jgi:hypothetical protein
VVVPLLQSAPDREAVAVLASLLMLMVRVGVPTQVLLKVNALLEIGFIALLHVYDTVSGVERDDGRDIPEDVILGGTVSTVNNNRFDGVERLPTSSCSIPPFTATEIVPAPVQFETESEEEPVLPLSTIGLKEKVHPAVPVEVSV